MATRQHPATIARRFRLFAFAKDFMDEHQRSPTVRAAMEALDIEDQHRAAVQYDFRKLRRAVGLPFELRSVSDRREKTGLTCPDRKSPRLKSNPKCDARMPASAK